MSDTQSVPTQKCSKWPLLVLFVVFLTLSVTSVLQKNFTYDEGNHFNYGNQIVFGGVAVRPMNSVMPATGLNALLFKLSSSLTVARMATTLFALLACYYIFTWAHELYGRRAGYLAAILFCLCPNILAHASLVTTDTYALGTAVIASYYFWRFVNAPTVLSAILAGGTLGLAQAAKFTNVALYLIFAAIVVVRAIARVSRLARAHQLCGRAVLIDVLRYGCYSLLGIAASILLINAACLFQDVFVPLGDFQFRSSAFRSIQQHFPWLTSLPVPVAYSWLQGLDWVMSDSASGAATPYIYLLGEIKDPAKGQFFKGYYFIVSFFKIPLVTQLMLVAALFLFLLHTKSYAFLRNELFLFVPVLFFSYFFNFSMPTQVGLRHFMVVFPFLFVFAGSVLRTDRFRGLRGAVVLFVVFLSLAGESVRTWPHFIGYTNDFVADKRRAYELFADSNLAWGGDEYWLQAYLADHLDAQFDPRQPTSGTILVGLNELVGINYPETYRWLREHFKPVATVGTSYLVYQISAEELAALNVGAKEAGMGAKEY